MANSLDTDGMVALRDAARIPVQQAIELISEGVTRETFSVTGALESRFRRILLKLLEVRDELK